MNLGFNNNVLGYPLYGGCWIDKVLINVFAYNMREEIDQTFNNVG